MHSVATQLGGNTNRGDSFDPEIDPGFSGPTSGVISILPDCGDVDEIRDSVQTAMAPTKDYDADFFEGRNLVSTYTPEETREIQKICDLLKKDKTRTSDILLKSLSPHINHLLSLKPRAFEDACKNLRKRIIEGEDAISNNGIDAIKIHTRERSIPFRYRDFVASFSLIAWEEICHEIIAPHLRLLK